MPSDFGYTAPMDFSSAHPTLLRALEARGYSQPTPVQAAVLEPAHLRRDLLVSAETGSGKTVAFGLAMADLVLDADGTAGRAGPPRALVIAPTRELAQQVRGELEWLFAPAGARIAACVGGMEIRRELRALADGTHLVVGTPGRLCDHLDRGSLRLDSLRALVLDEADEMLDMGFREELESILSRAPADRRTLLFSATIPDGIEHLASRYQRDAVRISVNPPRQPHRDIDYRLHHIALREREHAVVNVLRAHEVPGAIVFCATREGVAHLSASLAERGFAVAALSGELSQAERTRALKALRDGRARVLVATDVAARGLDLPDVGLVVHADLPHDSQVLQHRSGRTGRAGRKGTSVVLVPWTKRRAAEGILRGAGLHPSREPVPDAAFIRTRDEERIVRELASLEPDLTEEDFSAGRRMLSERAPEQLAAMLAAVHRARLPAPEELPLTAELASRPDRPHPVRPAPAPRPHMPAAAIAPPREGFVWFRVGVGRDGRADPKWLLPMICRRGGITKAEIGAIRILADETRVEISSSVAGRFGAAVRKPDKQDRFVRISPCTAPRDQVRARAGRPPRRDNR